MNKDNKNNKGDLPNNSKQPHSIESFKALVETKMADLGDMGILSFLQNNTHQFQPIPLPVGTPEEHFEKMLPRIEKFVDDFAKHTGAGEFFPQNTQHMTQEDRIKSIDQRLHMAMAPLIEDTAHKIASMRQTTEIKPSVNKKLN